MRTDRRIDRRVLNGIDPTGSGTPSLSGPTRTHGWGGGLFADERRAPPRRRRPRSRGLGAPPPTGRSGGGAGVPRPGGGGRGRGRWTVRCRVLSSRAWSTIVIV